MEVTIPINFSGNRLFSYNNIEKPETICFLSKLSWLSYLTKP